MTNQVIPDAAVEAWGLADNSSVWVMSEAAARESANDDLGLVCKIDGEWGATK